MMRGAFLLQGGHLFFYYGKERIGNGGHNQGEKNSSLPLVEIIKILISS